MGLRLPQPPSLPERLFVICKGLPDRHFTDLCQLLRASQEAERQAVVEAIAEDLDRSANEQDANGLRGGAVLSRKAAELRAALDQRSIAT